MTTAAYTTAIQEAILGSVIELPLSVIHRTGWNPRKTFEVTELMDSILERGVIVPISVRPRPDGEYDLVDGDRRFTSSENLNLPTIPAIARKYTDTEVKETMYLANLHRADLSPLEEAGGLRMLLDDLGMTQAELGKKLGKSQAYVANRLRLLTAPDELKELLISRKITQKHIIAVLPFTGYPVWPEISEMICDEFNGNSTSVSSLLSIIKRKLYQSDHVLDFDDLNYRYSDIKDIFNREGCDSCKHVHTHTYKEDHRDTDIFCLNESCWTARIELAETALLQQKQKSAVRVPGSIDTESMPRSEWENLSNKSWDTSKCILCDFSGRQQSNLDCLICVNPSCEIKKRKAYEKEIFEARVKDRQSAIKKADDYLLDIRTLDSDDMRIVLQHMASDIEYNPALRESLEPWPQFSDTETPLSDILKSIPNHDLAPIMLRISLLTTVLRSYNNTDSYVDDITAVLPDVVSK